MLGVRSGALKHAAVAATCALLLQTALSACGGDESSAGDELSDDFKQASFCQSFFDKNLLGLHGLAMSKSVDYIDEFAMGGSDAVLKLQQAFAVATKDADVKGGWLAYRLYGFESIEDARKKASLAVQQLAEECKNVDAEVSPDRLAAAQTRAAEYAETAYNTYSVEQ